MKESFSIPAGDQLIIRGDLHYAPDSDREQPLLLFCHGFKGFKDWGSFPYAAEALSERGIAVIRFNFSCNGVGESLTEFDELEKFSRNTYAREWADLSILSTCILEDRLPVTARFDKDKLFVLGHSKGGADAILFGAGNPAVKGIITWNGVAHVDLFDQSLRREIRENGIGYIPNARTGQLMPIRPEVIEDVDRNAAAYDLLVKVSEMTQPLCIIQGEKDYPRLVNGAARLHEAARHSELHWIADGDHTFHTRHPFTGSSPQLEQAIELTSAFIHAHTP